MGASVGPHGVNFEMIEPSDDGGGVLSPEGKDQERSSWFGLGKGED